ncbi:2,3-dihydro-2,3-dihydroxybenzoate dehydrogenase [Massilia sp. CCM 8734]|uniref:2,3-dihydro-2,3-dihydroxybenzoate dehydrogenase n=1 Tax=Massilia sp. CCM 8734 TaxID=2609283 RepID=UPI00141EBFB0|nr:2,3-dihydro-2,3-dihydroxybenzoate dehydrogenase [Massilia sp. CCM 8734]NHZ95271.1 2,3-dihydro-2,3-dihydroxybenzoate dehydrogenase [Massilia sp. CCM 8734]
MGNQFEGKVALVSGAAQGIGAAVARQLAAGGAAVAVIDVKAGAVEDMAATLRASGALAIGMAVDVTDSAAVNAAVARVRRELGEIDVLVNVAGILRMGSILDYSDDDWERTFAVNAGGVFRLCRAVAAGMVERKRGAIVTVASNASTVPRMQMGAYAASKAASTQFTRCLGLELAPYGIRCNVVSPGSTDTEMQRQLWNGADGSQGVIKGSLETFRLGIPLKRIATPEDIADAVLYLASDAARHITMHDLRIDGGATLGG